MRSKISKKNVFYLSPHRYYELKHRCLQYKEWTDGVQNIINETDHSNDPTGNKAIKIDILIEKMGQVEKSAELTDPILKNYILKNVAYGLSYSCIRARTEIPCSRDIFYDLIREFYWRLDKLAK